MNIECVGCANKEGCGISNRVRNKCPCVICLIKSICSIQCKERISFFYSDCNTPVSY